MSAIDLRHDHHRHLRRPTCCSQKLEEYSHNRGRESGGDGDGGGRKGRGGDREEQVDGILDEAAGNKACDPVRVQRTDLLQQREQDGQWGLEVSRTLIATLRESCGLVAVTELQKLL
jgi:hypothetical protein